MCRVHLSALHCIPMLLTYQEQEAQVWILPVPGDMGYTLYLMQQPGCDLLALPTAGVRVSAIALPGQQHSLQHS